jgi:hypothetical protein
MIRLLSAMPYYNKENEKEYTHIQVHVKNTGDSLSRRVIIHYKEDSVWMDKSLKLIRSFRDHSLYTGSINKSLLEFAVKYETDEGIFWDNNNNINYKIGLTLMDNYEPGTVGGNISLLNAKTLVQVFQKYGHILPYYGIEGAIYVKNISSKKQVGFRITYDNWHSWQNLEAYYDKTLAVNGTPSLIEVWRVFPKYISIGDNGKANFLISAYFIDEESHITYWDNNFENNYLLLRSEDSEVQ